MSDLKQALAIWEEGDPYITTDFATLKEEFNLTHAFLNPKEDRNSALKAGDELILRISPTFANRAKGVSKKFIDLLSSEELTIKPNTSDRPGIGTIVHQDLIEL